MTRRSAASYTWSTIRASVSYRAASAGSTAKWRCSRLLLRLDADAVTTQAIDDQFQGLRRTEGTSLSVMYAQCVEALRNCKRVHARRGDFDSCPPSPLDDGAHSRFGLRVHQNIANIAAVDLSQRDRQVSEQGE